MLEQQPELAEMFAGRRRLDGRPAWLDLVPHAVLDRYFTLEDPRRLEPAERELYVETLLDSGLLLRGFVDRVDVAPDGAIRVVDYKTGRSPGEMFEAKALFQMKFYALVIWRTRGVIPRMLQLVYLGNGEILRYEPDERDLLATERKVEALWHAIRGAQETGDCRPSPSAAVRLVRPPGASARPWAALPPPLPRRPAHEQPGARRAAGSELADERRAPCVSCLARPGRARRPRRRRRRDAGRGRRRGGTPRHAVAVVVDVRPRPSRAARRGPPRASGRAGRESSGCPCRCRRAAVELRLVERVEVADHGPLRVVRRRGSRGSSAPRCSGPQVARLPAALGDRLRAARVERAARAAARGVRDLAARQVARRPSGPGPARGSPPAAPSCTDAGGCRRSPRSGPISTIRPRYMIAIRSQKNFALARSWVM